MRIKRKVISVCAFCVLFLSFLSVSAFGAVFNVTDTAGLSSALTTASGNGEDDTINVAAGTYDVTSVLSYSSTELFTLTIQGAGAEDTILKGGDCQIMNISSSATVEVDGLTFLNGKDDDFGGGLFVVVSNTDLTVTNCVFQGNYSDELGGGAYVNSAGTSQGTITFDNNVFRLNGAANTGGGLYARGDIQYNYELQLTNNLFWGNEARSFHGGGAYVIAGGYTDAASIIAKNTFLYNYAGGRGGGLYAELGSFESESGSGGRVINNLFKRNRAEDGLSGGGAYFTVNTSGTAMIINNTCIENSGSGSGGGFFFYLTDYAADAYDITVHINNNIIGNNDSEVNQGIDCYVVDRFATPSGKAATVYLNNNDYPEDNLYILDGSNLAASGNISDDPMIEALGDLSEGSPCIDAGTASYAPDFDIHGEVRPNGGVIDIGADEFYDDDEDGLPDYWETLTGQTEWDADPDEDGMNNLEEYSYGLDPLVPAYDASGEWDITVSSLDTDCDGIDIEDTTVTVTQVEGDITLVVDGQTFEGVFNGLDSTYYLQASETEEGDTTTFTIAFSLTTESSGTGTISWIKTDDETDALVCSGTADLTVACVGADDDDSGFCFIQAVR